MLALLLSCTFISPAELDDRIAANACNTGDCVGHGSRNDDADGDGFLSVAAGGDDCDDGDPTVNPAAVEVWYDGIDQDCAGDNDNDQDGDGFESSTVGGDDCYDAVEDPYPVLSGDCAEPSTDIAPEDVHPGAADAVYDGTDADCSGGTDFDKDGDTYPSCEDCNDEDASVYPSDTPEIWYNGVDENCDRNDGDQDGDGFVVEGYSAAWIDPESSLRAGDCWDDPGSIPSDYLALNDFAQVAANTVSPDADETWYDGVDANCDGSDDFDADADSYPTDAYPNRAGEIGPDCDDGDGSVHPGAPDPYYDGVDANCDAKSDYDQDGDSYDNGVDCDDTKAGVNPEMNEDCSTGYDDDCDGSADDIDGDGCTMFNKDADGDAYGTTSTACACGPSGVYTASNDDDCNDYDASTYPGAADPVYDGIDEDCDGASDYDADGDGADAVAFGGDDCDDTDASVYAGAAETYYDGIDSDCAGDSDFDVDGDGDDAEAAGGTDCDDFTATVHPGATETVADGVDEDCDGVDSCYTDADGDNYGTTVVVDGSSLSCLTGSGATVSTDCDDTDSTTHPSALEIDDGLDNDCDGWADEDFVSVGDLIISEVARQTHVGGTSTNTNGHWFEVYNTSTRDINLSNWLFTRSSAVATDLFYVDPADDVIAPAGDYAVFCKTDDYTAASTSASTLLCDYYWGDETEAATYSDTYHDNTFNLQRDEDTLTAYIGGDATAGTAIDAVHWTYSSSSGYWPRDATRTLSLDVGSLDGASNDSLTAWCSTPSSGVYRWFDASNDEYGTPGSANYDCP